MNGRIHSERFKAEALRKLATSGRPVREVAAEMGVHETLLYRWRRESGKGADVITRQPPAKSPVKTPSEPAEPPRRPQDWSADEKIAAIFEAHGLDEAQLGGFLRQRGLHRAVLEEWREAMLRGGKAEHLHSALSFVTPSDRHTGRHLARLAGRAKVYAAARRKHPERWSRNIRRWDPIPTVCLNPEPGSKIATRS